MTGQGGGCLVVDRDRSARPLILAVAPLRPTSHVDHSTFNADCSLSQAYRSPSQAEKLASSKAVKHCQPERPFPAVSPDCLEETLNLGFSPHLSVSFGSRFGHLSWHCHTSSWIATKLSYGHRVVEGSSQHHSDDLDAATRKPTFCRETLKPSRDVVSFNLVGTDPTQAGLDVASRPLVLLPCLVRHVDLAGYPPIYEASNGPPIRRDVA